MLLKITVSYLLSHVIFHSPELYDLAMTYVSHTCVCLSVVFTQPGDEFACCMDSQSGEQYITSRLNKFKESLKLLKSCADR